MYTYMLSRQDMMKLITFLTFVTISCAAAPFPNPDYDQFWSTYKVQHGKQYDGQLDAKMRRYIWEKNLRFIINHNYEADMGQHTFRLGMNEHGDLTDAEYRKLLMGLSEGNMTYSNPTFLEPKSINLPSEVDWRKKGYVTPVKNQKSCGSCWAFSAVGSLEGQHFRKTGKLVSLSEQNLVDCSRKYGNDGCNGGFPQMALKYIEENDGIDTEDSYPYTAKDGTCHFSKFNIGATVSGYVGITKGSEEDLQTAVATVGPISVSIDASSSTFRFYKTGVYINDECSTTSLDHAVLAVGYGGMEGQNYWTVKNSWGESWGQNGYILMARNYGNMCGIATEGYYPLV